MTWIVDYTTEAFDKDALVLMSGWYQKTNESNAPDWFTLDRNGAATIPLAPLQESGESGDYVRHLGQLVHQGTVDPIVVDQQGGVHDGAHRVAGARHVGATHIRAYVAH